MNSPPLLDNLRVVLVATRNPLNIGAAARAMSNFGCTHLRLVNPYDPAYREARSAVGAAPVLASAEQFSTVAEAVADCPLVVGTTAAGRRELHHQLCTLEAGARIILQRLTRKRAARGKKARAALLFGSEKTGLSNEDLSHCHWLLRMPTRAEHRSMNLGQTVAVCLYELVRDAKAPTKLTRALKKPPPPPRPHQGDRHNAPNRLEAERHTNRAATPAQEAHGLEFPQQLVSRAPPLHDLVEKITAPLNYSIINQHKPLSPKLCKVPVRKAC